MENAYFLSDFDFSVGDILIVNKNSMTKTDKWNGFQKGRNIDGLVYCESGEGTYTFQKNKITLKEGEVMFLPANCSYVLTCDDLFVHYVTNFKFEILEMKAPSILNKIFEEKELFKTNSAKELYKSQFKNLINVWQNKNNGYRVISRQLIFKLLTQYFTDIDRNSDDFGEYSKIRLAIEYLNEQFFEEIKVEKLANLCNMSETHFRRIFLKNIGMSPIEYKITRQLLFAKDLLLSRNFTVKEVAYTSGFSTPHYFTRIFTQKEGITPTEFMNRNS